MKDNDDTGGRQILWIIPVFTPDRWIMGRQERETTSVKLKNARDNTCLLYITDLLSNHYINLENGMMV